MQTRTLTRNSAAKNLALAGVKSLTLCDPKPVALPDLSSQFYFGEADVGKNRAEVSAAALSDLNPYCEIKVHAGEVSGATIKPYQVRPSAVAPNAKPVFHQGAAILRSSPSVRVACYCDPAYPHVSDFARPWSRPSPWGVTDTLFLVVAHGEREPRVGGGGSRHALLGCGAAG